MWRAVARRLAPAAGLARGCRALSAAAIGPGAALGARAGAPGRGPALGGSARRPRGLLPAAVPRVGPRRCCSLPAHQKVRGGPATFPSPSPAFLPRLRSLPSCPFPYSFPFPLFLSPSPFLSLIFSPFLSFLLSLPFFLSLPSCPPCPRGLQAFSHSLSSCTSVLFPEPLLHSPPLHARPCNCRTPDPGSTVGFPLTIIPFSLNLSGFPAAPTPLTPWFWDLSCRLEAVLTHQGLQTASPRCLVPAL